MQCKLRCVNFRRVSDPRRAFQPAFGVTEISDDWYRSTVEVIVTSMETPRSARENFACTWEYLGVVQTKLGAQATSLGAPTARLGAPATSQGAPQIIVDQSGKNIFGNAAGALGNHSYY